MMALKLTFLVLLVIMIALTVHSAPLGKWL